MNRRTFIGSIAALPLALVTTPAAPAIRGLVPLKFVGVEELNGQSWDGWHSAIPIVYGEISDELMPQPPYYRAHDMGDIYDMGDGRTFDGRWSQVELVR